MNDRVKSLKQQAQEFYIGYPDAIYNELVDQKFAELIVKDCVAVVDTIDYTIGLSECLDITTRIELHFGVFGVK